MADVGENGSVAGGNAIAGQQPKEPSEDLIDCRGGVEILDGTKKFGGGTFIVVALRLD